MGTMLLKQYRMHSSIMQVINQFYDDQLELGYESLDANRNHNCGGGLFSNDCHAVWIDVPSMLIMLRKMWYFLCQCDGN